MSNNFITLKELIKRLNEQNIDLNKAMVDSSVDIHYKTTISALISSKEESSSEEQDETSEEVISAPPETNNTLRVTFSKFKKMFNLGEKAIIGNQVPGCTFEPVKQGSKYRHVLMDLSNPALELFSESIRSIAKNRKATSLFFTLKMAQDKLEITESVARRRLANQPCITLINTERKGRSIWPLKSILAAADKN